MLLIPPVLGWAAAREVTGGSLLAAIGVALLFVARASIVPAVAGAFRRTKAAEADLRRRAVWGVAFTVGGLFCLTAGVALATERTGAVIAAGLVLGLGLVHAGLGASRRDRGVPAELFAMAGLAAAAALVATAAGVAPGSAALAPAVLSLAYFLSTLACVRAFGRRPGRIGAGTSLVIHVLLWAALGALAWRRWLPAATILAFAPVLGRAVWYAAAPPRSVIALGWREVGVACAFTSAAVASFLV